MAWSRLVKNFVGHGTVLTPSVKLAITRSTGERPNSAILDAAQGSPKTARASRATDFVVAISTSIGRRVAPQMRFTSSNARRADAPVILTPCGHTSRSRPSSLIVNDSYSPLSAGWLTPIYLR